MLFLIVIFHFQALGGNFIFKCHFSPEMGENYRFKVSFMFRLLGSLKWDLRSPEREEK